jgi:hypothetical protein
MLSIFRHTRLLPLIAAIIPAALLASPKIEVDTADYNIGAFIEGQAQTVKHVFRITNAGDSALIITNVRPGCGCTTVSHDTVIAPGATGAITAEINTANIHNGEFHKSITVTSNAKANSPLMLSISGAYKKIVEFEPNHVRIRSAEGKDEGSVVTIFSLRDSLKVRDALFAFNENNPSRVPQSKIPLRCSLLGADSVTGKEAAVRSSMGSSKNERLFTYKLKLTYAGKEKMDKFGEVIISTNLPEKPEIRISATLDAGKE